MGSVGIVTTHNDGNFLLSSETRSFAQVSMGGSSRNKAPDFIRIEDSKGRSVFSLNFEGRIGSDDQWKASDFQSLMNKWRGRSNVVNRSAKSTYDKTFRDAIKAGKTPAQAQAAARDARDVTYGKSFQKFAEQNGVRVTLKSKRKVFRAR